MKNKSSKILECVPNFSEGHNFSVIQKIQESISKTVGVRILHVDIGASVNRTVITFAGEPDAVVEAAFQGVKTAAHLIDLRKHQGIHPRIGATDVVPLVPVRGVRMREAITLSHHLGRRIGKELGIPVYCYEKSASILARKNLENIRKGGYEGLLDKISDHNWRPDFGPVSFNSKSGATVVGARNFLVAYNVNLDSGSVKMAAEIAARIRTSGKIIVKNGKKIRTPGLLGAVKAIGWYIEEYGKAQVSMNLTNIKKTPLHKAYETVKSVASELGIKVTGSEIIGLIPEKALINAGIFYASGNKKINNKDKTVLINIAVEKLGLNEIKPFLPEERIIEYLIE